MGMAASQARLLTITARLADNELRSQTINNAKMRLATESAQASDDYVTALNNARMMFKNMDLTGTSQSQLLTFNSLTAYSPYNTQYGLVNSAGLLLVSEDEAKIFEKSGNNLEKYLANHGLSWDTTYFDENKNLTDRLKSYYSSDEFKLYPKPEDYATNGGSVAANAYKEDPGLFFLFTRIDEQGGTQELTSETLKDLYEKYLSNDVSIERTAFRTAQTQYTSQKRALYSNAVQDIWDKLKTATSKTSLTDIAQEIGTTNTQTGQDVITWLKNKKIEYLDEDFVAWAEKLKVGAGNTVAGLNGTEINPNTLKNGEINTATTKTSTTGAEVDVNGCTKYKIGTLIFYVKNDGTNKIAAIESDDKDGKTQYGGSITGWTRNQDNAQKVFVPPSSIIWPSVLNGLTEKDDGTAAYTEYKYTKTTDTENVSIITHFANETDAQNAIKEEILSSIVNQYDSLNLDTYVETSGTTYAQTYKDNRNEFYKLIFENYPYVANAPNNNDAFKYFKDGNENQYGYCGLFGDIENDTNLNEDAKEKLKLLGENFSIDNVQSLSDFTVFLQYIHEYQAATGGSPAFTSAFQNIIDAFTVELMLDELGEPKYAWVDETDKSSNQENADAKAQWYENLFNRMRNGYAVLEDGLASSADWIEHAFESGIVTMEQVDKSYNWLSIDYKCCANITEDTDNSAAVAIAEAKYNRAMNDIKRKDNMFDMQLKNIDTEHNALQTEYDVIKGVIAKNIERTMKFDQSA